MTSTVSSTNYDGYRWENNVHCRYIQEKGYVQYTPADDTDGLWVKTIYADGTIEWSERQPTLRGAHKPLVKAYTNTLTAEFFVREGDEGEISSYPSMKALVDGVTFWAEANHSPISWLYNVGDALYPMQGAVIWLEGARPIV